MPSKEITVADEPTPDATPDPTKPPRGKTTLALVGAVSKHDTFDPSLSGIPEIKTEIAGGTEVPSADVDAILTAAKTCGVLVQKVS